MAIFKQHTVESAPKEASAVLEKVVDRYRFIPNLAAYVAESAVTLDAIMALSGFFDKTSLTPQEQQVVLLTVSVQNGCAYCKTVHAALGHMQGVNKEMIHSILNNEVIPDPKLNALRDFTQSIIEERGWVNEDKVNQFIQAGFSKAQVFEVLMGVSLKTLTNYCSHIVGAEPNAEFASMAAG